MFQRMNFLDCDVSIASANTPADERQQIWNTQIYKKINFLCKRQLRSVIKFVRKQMKGLV